ncbi:hypothetical protein MEG_00665 [Bartonella tamiae Th307]|uniref:Uncharacterized protein n=1 Tax=Bartonella tamiae Th239 TaxID=1094558 RepID=J0QS34_9HYPH|nr:hypothetical protein ME5_01217 [Bartonella tamiae Th239]EJF95084.1 hypothetical protein MEG_00665 [Bartonella tamiae Th307]
MKIMMSYHSSNITENETRNWLVEKIAEKFNILVSDVVVDKFLVILGLIQQKHLYLSANWI